MTVIGADGPAPTEPTAPTEPAGTCKAVKYDTWGQLALNNYGSYGAWRALKKANGGKEIKAGMEITLPEKVGSYTRMAPAAAGEGETLYTVKVGDTLGSIAAQYYGSVKEYKAIFERNSDRIKNANMIYEGQIIVLPAKAK